MARQLTPERQKLKDQALSLRYDYGWTERRIATHLQLPQKTINRLVSHNINKSMSHNNGHITHLEGDCRDLIKDIPDNSVNCLITDPPYSVMDDYEWDKKDDEFYHQWLSTLIPKLSQKHSGFIFFDSRRTYDFEGILRNYVDIKNRIIWIRKNMSLGRIIRDRFISSYEVVYYFGNRSLDLPENWGAERFDTCEFAVPQSNFKDKKLHPTQKPINLILQLLRVGSYPGDVVLDCFAGSGVVGRACQIVGNRKCILIEMEPEYNELIKVMISGRNNQI